MPWASATTRANNTICEGQRHDPLTNDYPRRRHVVIIMPFIMRSVLPQFSDDQRSLENASRDLGAGPFLTFFLVTLPQIRSGVISGAVLAFITSWISVEISMFQATPALTTIPVTLFNYVQYTVDPSIAAVSSVTILVAAGLIVLLDFLFGIDVISSGNNKPEFPMLIEDTYDVLYTHTEGEPLCIVHSGISYPAGTSIVEKKLFLEKHYDWLRLALMREPRGHKDMVGVFVTPRSSTSATPGSASPPKTAGNSSITAFSPATCSGRSSIRSTRRKAMSRA